MQVYDSGRCPEPIILILLTFLLFTCRIMALVQLATCARYLWQDVVKSLGYAPVCSHPSCRNGMGRQLSAARSLDRL